MLLTPLAIWTSLSMKICLSHWVIYRTKKNSEVKGVPKLNKLVDGGSLEGDRSRLTQKIIKRLVPGHTGVRAGIAYGSKT